MQCKSLSCSSSFWALSASGFLRATRLGEGLILTIRRIRIISATKENAPPLRPRSGRLDDRCFYNFLRASAYAFSYASS